MTFKVGDKVRKIKFNYNWCKKEDILEVTCIFSDCLDYKNLSRSDQPNGGARALHFELVEESTPEPTLQAKRFNTGKVEFHDLPLLALAEVSKVGVIGRAKYDRYNWKKGAPVSQYLDCGLRHKIKYMYGEDLDLETLCHHLAHDAWNSLAALEQIITGNEDDDRYKKYKIPNVSKLFELNDEQKAIVQKLLDKKDKK